MQLWCYFQTRPLWWLITCLDVRVCSEVLHRVLHVLQAFQTGESSVCQAILQMVLHEKNIAVLLVLCAETKLTRHTYSEAWSLMFLDLIKCRRQINDNPAVLWWHTLFTETTGCTFSVSFIFTACTQNMHNVRDCLLLERKRVFSWRRNSNEHFTSQNRSIILLHILL